jgi:hypothetical protein
MSGLRKGYVDVHVTFKLAPEMTIRDASEFVADAMRRAIDANPSRGIDINTLAVSEKVRSDKPYSTPHKKWGYTLARKGRRERRGRMLRLGRLLYRRGQAQQKQAADASEQTEQQTATAHAEADASQTPERHTAVAAIVQRILDGKDGVRH